MTLMLTFGANRVEFFPDSTRITLHDGATICGMPEDTDSYRETAAEHGYRDDTLRLCQEHELTHVALAHILGLAESPTMRMVASGNGHQRLANIEEAAVLALQRFANVVGVNLIDRFRDIMISDVAEGLINNDSV
jgi:hypothetical protein